MDEVTASQQRSAPTEFVGLRAPGALIAVAGGITFCAVLFTIALWYARYGTSPGSLDELRRMVAELRYQLTLYGFLTWVVVGAAFGMAAKRFRLVAGGGAAALTTRVAAIVAAGYVVLRYLVVAPASSGHLTRVILNVAVGCTYLAVGLACVRLRRRWAWWMIGAGVLALTMASASPMTSSPVVLVLLLFVRSAVVLVTGILMYRDRLARRLAISR
jgi:hypothetical protein